MSLVVAGHVTQQTERSSSVVQHGREARRRVLGSSPRVRRVVPVRQVAPQCRQLLLVDSERVGVPDDSLDQLSHGRLVNEGRHLHVDSH